MSTRTEIIAAARDIYAETGPQALSMRAVARRVGVSATAIYRHFESKEELVVEVCEEGFRLFETYLARGLQGESPYERLRRTGTGYRDFGLDNPQYYRVMFMSAHPEFSELTEVSERKTSPTFQMLVDRVAECQRHNLMPQRDPEALAAMIWANVHGMVSLFLDGHFRAMSAAVFRDFFDEQQHFMHQGLRPR